MLTELDTFRLGAAQIKSVAILESRTVVAASWEGSLAFRDWTLGRTSEVAVGDGKAVMALVGPTALGDIAVAGFDGSLRLIEPKQHDCRKHIPISALPLTCAALLRGGELLAVGGRSRDVFILDTDRLSVIHTFREHDGWVESVSARADGGLLASGTQGGTVELWDVVRGTRYSRFAAHSGAVMCVAFSDDGRTLVSGGQDNLVKVWTIGQRATLIKVLVGHENTVRGVALCIRKNLLLSISQDRSIRFWRLNDGSPIHCHQTNDEWLTALATTSDFSMLATGSATGMVRLWKIAS